ncbi:PREDICTED: signaling lymphocytic activation molecule-like isoform X2 [Calidris pugnax]|uniref:signaling lymphocytic activation molecule-like isoform X2 n=1 Tax=Calidris pugnax TaxID=198806 RepID=UPI00071CEDB9|nr:PREDICTED: signaling lymphocytic activation molecule-like isoform X2 [Calidris pugnax]
MGCSARIWLLISLGSVWGMGCGAREMVLGTLGKATLLQIPLELQNLTLSFGEALWKRDTEDPQRKRVLLKYSNGNYTNYMERRTRFHMVNFSLEILNTSREDSQLHEYIVNKGSEEKVWQIQLQVYEPVSNPSIQVVNRELTNSSCTVTLNCTAERGDNISYSWDGGDTIASGLCSHNGSVLHLSYPLQDASISCFCTASNPVSHHLKVITFNSSKCSDEQGDSAGVKTGHLVLMVVVPIIAVVMLTGVFVVTHLSVSSAVQEQQQPPLAEDNTVHTIYSQVQRVEKQKGLPVTEHPSCTTIYAAATGLPPDTAPSPRRAPRHPHSPQTQPPAHQGHLSLSQSPDKEPTTVYASVMMPVA